MPGDRGKSRTLIRCPIRTSRVEGSHIANFPATAIYKCARQLQPESETLAMSALPGSKLSERVRTAGWQISRPYFCHIFPIRITAPPATCSANKGFPELEHGRPCPKRCPGSTSQAISRRKNGGGAGRRLSSLWAAARGPAGAVPGAEQWVPPLVRQASRAAAG